MNVKIVLKISSLLLFFLALSMVLPLGVSLIYGGKDTNSFLISIGITIAFSFVIYLFTRNTPNELSFKESIFIVTLVWCLFTVFGALPYMFSNSMKSFTDAAFESMSGFTTTGSSILTNIEVLPKGILFWRAMTQWLGGMGIIVLSIAILPLLGVGGMELFKAEVPGPVKDKLTPRVKDTAKTLWMLYLFFTLAQILFLLLGKMSLYDSVCHAFTTLSTGGFSTKNISVEYYNSNYIYVVITIFMLIGGTNFNLLYFLFKGNFKQLLKNSEFLGYMGVFFIASFFITINIFFTKADFSASGNFVDSVIQSTFQVSSIMTTTGFSNTNWELWPHLSIFVLLILFLIGSMAGSTGGSIKIIRYLVLLKHSLNQLYRIVHPQAITSIKLDKKSIPRETIESIWGFVFIYLLILGIGTFILTALNIDILTSFSSVATALGNIGPGVNLVGPYDNFSFLPDIAKWVLIICMLVGRLEIYTVLVLFTTYFWEN